MRTGAQAALPSCKRDACSPVPLRESLPTHKLIPLYPKPPRLIGVLARIVDADAFSDTDVVGSKRTVLFQPNATSQKVLAVVVALDAKGDADRSRPRGQIPVFHLAATNSHDLDALDRFDRPNEHDMGRIDFATNYVKLKVHPVDEENICVTAQVVCCFVSRRSPAAVTMGGSVYMPEICLGFDYHPGCAVPLVIRHDQKLTQEVPGDPHRVFTKIKRTRELAFHTQSDKQLYQLFHRVDSHSGETF